MEIFVASLFFLFVVRGCNGKGSKWKLWDHTVHLQTWDAEKRKTRYDVNMLADASSGHHIP